ncbi:MAG: hemolysin family protein [Hespellia sp.]|nr:hemolysin family protein [Hespellia sp.]
MENEKLLDKMRHILAENYLPTSEQEMIRNIFEYADKDAKDIMTHRKNIIAIDAKETLEDAIRFVVEESNSRFPIYEENIDNIIGTVHVKDMMKCYLDEGVRHKPIKEIENLIRPVSVVPETKDIDTLFKEMQRNKNHMVIVLDEYGMTSGLVAMEDILEEIVGNIMDEYDEEEEKITLQPDGTYIVPGLTELNDLEDLLHIEFEEEDFDTLNGFLVDELDHIPAEDEVCHVDYGGYRFYVVEVNDNIIQTVKIEKINEEC